MQVFAPHIVSYLEKEEATLREELDDALERETWLNENCTEVRYFVIFRIRFMSFVKEKVQE